jgi:hypothetical protein
MIFAFAFILFSFILFSFCVVLLCVFIFALFLTIVSCYILPFLPYVVLFLSYGAQHPIVVHTERTSTDNYVVVGHCCESGDLFTCAPGQPEVLQERLLHTASIGDVVSIEAAGAYCASMSTKNYNSFPEAPEVLLGSDNEIILIRRFVISPFPASSISSFFNCAHHLFDFCSKDAKQWSRC